MTTMTIRLPRSNAVGLGVPAEGMSLLMGVPVGEMRDHMANQNDGQITLRPQWVQDGRRRAREAQAHTGCTDLIGVMTYWAKKDLDADLFIEFFDVGEECGTEAKTSAWERTGGRSQSGDQGQHDDDEQLAPRSLDGVYESGNAAARSVPLLGQELPP